MGTGRHVVFVLEQGVGDGSSTLGLPLSYQLPLVSLVLAFHRPCHSLSTEGRGSMGKVHRVDKHWEGFIKVSLEQFRT